LLPLMRLRYGGSANRWGFALYLASHDGYRDEVLPSGFTAGTPRRSARLRRQPLPAHRRRTPDELTGLTTKPSRPSPGPEGSRRQRAGESSGPHRPRRVAAVSGRAHRSRRS
jgi:hypothetical protein